ncbi:ferric reductase-like transmembrane domain-containing protein [Roseobacter sp.]|uniref:ferric reductase-like transmembrane domain-containing protein n=1 Tax=Roseobacter sp. TaxID=1907202 RepID=UPI0032969369
MKRTYAALVWAAVLAVGLAAVVAAAMSPLLAWRNPVYIVAGFAGVIAMALLLVQPVLATHRPPGLPQGRARKVHRAVGLAVVVAVIVHVGGLWVTSPPDVVDALMLRSPTPFSVWGVAAMWAVFATAALALMRRRLRLRPVVWRLCHTSLAATVAVGTVIHAMRIEGTMGPVTKIVLAAAVIAVTGGVLIQLRVWATGRRRIQR